MDKRLYRRAKVIAEVLRILVETGYIEKAVYDLQNISPGDAAMIGLSKDYLEDLDVAIHRYEVRHGMSV